MIEFIIRARRAPTVPEQFLGSAGQEAHVEYLTQVLVNGLFVSQAHRDNVVMSFVLEASPDFSRIIRFSGSDLGSIPEQTESGLLELFGDALKTSLGAQKDEVREVLPGITIAAMSFETLIKSYQDNKVIYLLDRKGSDVRTIELPENAVFVLTDHVPMPPKQAKSLVNRGAKTISLGPKMLHASQCVVLIENEYDRMG